MHILLVDCYWFVLNHSLSSLSSLCAGKDVRPMAATNTSRGGTARHWGDGIKTISTILAHPKPCLPNYTIAAIKPGGTAATRTQTAMSELLQPTVSAGMAAAVAATISRACTTPTDTSLEEETRFGALRACSLGQEKASSQGCEARANAGLPHPINMRREGCQTQLEAVSHDNDPK